MLANNRWFADPFTRRFKYGTQRLNAAKQAKLDAIFNYAW
jgi:hypothetical protein